MCKDTVRFRCNVVKIMDSYYFKEMEGEKLKQAADEAF